MSVPVPADAVEQHILGRPFAYVISLSDDGAHVIAVQVELQDGHLDCSRVGSSTRRNIASNATVTIVFPPAHEYADDEFASYSLVIDGSAVDRGERVLVRIESAVLHRPA